MNVDTRRDLAAKALKARKARHWNQSDLAAAAGVSVGAISNFERGLSFPQPNHLRAILAALDISLEGERVDEVGDEDTNIGTWFDQLPADIQTCLGMIGLYLERFDRDERDARIGEVTRAILERRL